MPTPYGLISMKRTLSYANGWAAEMVYCLAAGEVDAHIAANYLSAYPGTSYLHVAQITDEPWMDGDVVQASGMSNARKLTYNFALDYLNVPWPNQVAQPDHASGTTLRLSVKFSGQYLTFPASAFTPPTSTPTSNPDGSPYTGGPIQAAQEPPNKQTAILIPLQDYIVEWDRVQDLSSLDFQPGIGTVNSKSFMGSEAGTILLEGAQLDPSFVLNPSMPHSWKAIVTFKQRRIVVGTDVYGWNHEYKTKTTPPGWGLITMTSGQPAYQSTDFSDLFA